MIIFVETLIVLGLLYLIYNSIFGKINYLNIYQNH